ncbi:PQQ-binding-like beta-propeller repeat protein, partial [Candidatus Sumerlaeota bacterium]|nr:PQQ-binding-like beta-propeller repeat protein [Candidatus Sumerlaeota bacterium]
DQQRGSSGWYVLGGAYYFDSEATVVLTDNFTGGDSVVADAIRFWSVFTFIQMTDSHIGYDEGNYDTTNVVNELKTLGKVTMAAYGLDAPPPSFAIHTGDITEYGQEYWNYAMTIFSGVPFPIYYVQGNHDSTWSSCKERIREKHGANPYSFDHYDRGERFHFACLNSPIIQSPRAGFAREELDWLENDLNSLEPNTPVFINIHHPIDGASDPKPYDAYRLLDVLHPFRILSIFYGHGHSSNVKTFDNFRIVQGGSTYNNTANTGGNYNIIAVTHGRLYIANKTYSVPTASKSLLNMTIPASPIYPEITVSTPGKDSYQMETMIPVTASISSAAGTVSAVAFEWNGDSNWRPMSGSGTGPYTAILDASSAIHGRQWIRIRFSMESGGPWYKMVPFWHWDDFPKIRWMSDLEASSLSTPSILPETVYVGSNGGSLRCFHKFAGTQNWKYDAPSDVVSSPEVKGGRVVFGCGNSKVYCLDDQFGNLKWAKDVSGPVYGSPTIYDSSVYIGTIGTGDNGSRYLYSLNLESGEENWKFPVGNAIETKPCVLGDTVFFGAWDSWFYAVYTSSGVQRWKNQRNTSRYYSPADSWPVAAFGMIYVADRQYYMNVIRISDGITDSAALSYSSQAIAPDGNSLLKRATGGNLERVGFDNSPEWSVDCSLDSAPVAPLCRKTRISIVDQDGLVTVLKQDTGEIEYQFRIAHGYELHPVNIDDNGDVYASTYEGFFLCVTNNDLSDIQAWTFR